MCRDGVYASTIIVKMIKSEGQLSTLSPSSYFQARKKIETDPNIAKLVLAKIAETQREVDLTDGVKIKLRDRSWVLIRGSNTENVMRVSAEARSQAKADALVEQYSNVILELLPKENRNSQ
jgi:phosphomannomutase